MTLIRVNEGDSGERPKAGGRKKRSPVLYVEDNEMNWRVLETGLEKHFELVRAATAEEAFELLREQEFDLILMDIELANSKYNGIEITRILKHAVDAPIAPSALSLNVKHIPIIFVTAYSARYNKTELLTAGGCDLLLKPVDLDKLNSVMLRLIDYQMPATAEESEFIDAETGENKRNFARRSEELECLVHINAFRYLAYSSDISASGIRLVIKDLDNQDCPAVGA
ncbi:uncharacterized protein METZ01_LOCUS437748, partial [marine metagenome]